MSYKLKEIVGIKKSATECSAQKRVKSNRKFLLVRKEITPLIETTQLHVTMFIVVFKFYFVNQRFPIWKEAKRYDKALQ